MSTTSYTLSVRNICAEMIRLSDIVDQISTLTNTMYSGGRNCFDKTSAGLSDALEGAKEDREELVEAFKEEIATATDGYDFDFELGQNEASFYVSNFVNNETSKAFPLTELGFGAAVAWVKAHGDFIGFEGVAPEGSKPASA